MIFSVLTVAQWFLLTGLVAVILELLLGIDTGLDLIIVGSILILSGAIGSFFVGPLVPVIIATVLSILYFGLGRRYFKNNLTTTPHKISIDQLIGADGVVVTTITPHTAGQVKIDGEVWRATALDDTATIDIDTDVVVQELSGVTVHVSKTENTKTQ